MYGPFAHNGDHDFPPGDYFTQAKSPDNFHPNIEPIFARNYEYIPPVPRYCKYFDHEHMVEEKCRRRKHKERKENKYYEPCEMILKQKVEKKKRRRHRREKKHEFVHNNIQPSFNENISTNLKRDECVDLKKYRRSHSIDKIPTKDVISDRKLLKRSERHSSMERKQESDMEKNGKYFIRKTLENASTNNSILINNDEIEPHLNSIPQLFPYSFTKKRREKSKNKKTNLNQTNISEFGQLNHATNQKTSIKDEKFCHDKNNAWDFKMNEQPEFYEGCQRQMDRAYFHYHNNIEKDRLNRMVLNNHQFPVNDEKIINNILTQKEKTKNRNRELRNKEKDREHKKTRKNMKQLAQEATYFFTKEDNRQPCLLDPKEPKDKTEENIWENLNFELDHYRNADIEKTNNPVMGQQQRKKFEKFDLGLKHKSHNHKKHKHRRKEKTDGDIIERKRPASLNVKNKHKYSNGHRRCNFDENFKGFLKRCKSEISFDCLKNEKDIICIYKSKESFDEEDDDDPVKIKTKQEDKHTKNNVPDAKDECAPYFRNIIVLPTGPIKQEFDMFDKQESVSIFSHTTRNDVSTKPKKRISRSKQRSSKHSKEYYGHINGVDKEPTKEIQSHDRGTSTILDKNLELFSKSLKDERIDHTGKKVAKKNLMNANKGVSGYEENTSEIVRNDDQHKNVETLKSKDAFRFPDKKVVKSVGCEILSGTPKPPKKDAGYQYNRHNKVKSYSSQIHRENEVEQSSLDKRVERLMKYYKIDSQSIMNGFSANPHKTMKQFLADKLSDCLKKLQEEENDDIMHIQTDDFNMVKLVLSEDLENAEEDGKIEECFSDLFINYAKNDNSLEPSEVILDAKYESVEETIEPRTKNLSCYNTCYVETEQQKSAQNYFRDSNEEKIDNSCSNFKINEEQTYHNSERFPIQLKDLDNRYSKAYRNGEETNFPQSVNKSVSTYWSDPQWKVTKDESEPAPLKNNENFEHIRNQTSNVETSCYEHKTEERNYVDEYSPKVPKEMRNVNMNEFEKNYSNNKRECDIPAQMLSQNVQNSERNYLVKSNSGYPANSTNNKIKKSENIDNNYSRPASNFSSHKAAESSNDQDIQFNKSTYRPSENKFQDFEEFKTIRTSHNAICKSNFQSSQRGHQIASNLGYKSIVSEDPSHNNTQIDESKSAGPRSLQMRKKIGVFSETERIQKPNNFQNLPNTSPKKGYEYFEISPPRSKPSRKQIESDEGYSVKTIKNNPKQSTQPFGKASQIPKRIVNINRDSGRKNTPDISAGKSMISENNENFESTWNSREKNVELNNSHEKYSNCNAKNCETEGLRELTEEKRKTTNIPLLNKDGSNRKIKQDKQGSEEKDKMPSMLLTKTFRPTGPSSYEKRKMYDSMMRRNVKKRSQSLNSDQPKISPVVYEVRYCNVHNNLPFDSYLERSKSEQNLSNGSKKNENGAEKTKTDSSCTAKLNDREENDVNLSTEPSCFLKNLKKEEKRDDPPAESSYTSDSRLRKDEYLSFSSLPLSNSDDIVRVESDIDTCLFSEPSCLLKESKYHVTSKKTEPQNRNFIEDDNGCEETVTNYSSRSERILELIRDNLLYAQYPPPSKKVKPLNQSRKRRKKTQKVSVKPKSKTKYCEKTTGGNQRLKIVARLSKWNDNESKLSDEPSQTCHNMPEMTIDKINDNEIRVTFGDNKFDSIRKSSSSLNIENESLNATESFDHSESSRTTVINCTNCASSTSEKSEETLKEAKLIINSAEDSGYITKGLEVNNSETTIVSYIKNSSTENTTVKTIKGSSNWNDKDLAKLRIHLLFPYVYDDFELFEAAKNTDLIKYYIESENKKLKEAIHSISKKVEMSKRSRSVISLPSSKVISEEPSQLQANGIKSVVREGGFYNHQRFIALNNEYYSARVLSELGRYRGVGDSSDLTIPANKNLAVTESVNSCSDSSVKSGVTIKKSVVELFKFKSPKVNRSSSCVLSDSDTIVGVGLNDEKFCKNFQEIMEMECQKYAQKVRNRAEDTENNNEAAEFEEIPLNFLLSNEKLRSESRELRTSSNETCFDRNDSSEFSKNESNESFKSVQCEKDNSPPSKCQNSFESKLPSWSNSQMNLQFYPEDRISVVDAIQSVQATCVSSVDSSMCCSSRDETLNNISSGEVSKYSEKTFFDSLLAYYDKESELIKKLMSDDEFFVSLIEIIRSCGDCSQMFHLKEDGKKGKREKKRSIFSRFFRRKEKKSSETLFEGSEYTTSVNSDHTFMTRDSCYSFSKDLEDVDKDTNEIKEVEPEHLKRLAYRVKCHLEPMVKATISNSYASDKMKLAGFLKMVDRVAGGDFTFLNNGDMEVLETKLKEHIAQIFEKIYRIARCEVKQKRAFLDDGKIQLLKMLVAQYHMGAESHINILSIYIGRGLIETKEQLEDAIIFFMGQDSQDISLELFEKTCGIYRNK